MKTMQSPPGPETVIDGRTYLYFCGTGYLGLQGHPSVIEAACQATHQYGLCSATSRAGFGNSPPILELEQQIAAFFGTESAFCFPSGYLGTYVLFSHISESADVLFLDEYAHFSIEEACRFSGLPVIQFQNADAEDLRRSMKCNLPPGGVPAVLSDGVFAARGSIAPVPDYLDVLGEFSGSMLCLDDCHAVGVLGKDGRGTYSHFNLHRIGWNRDLSEHEDPDTPRLLVCGTLSKAFGSYGGILYGTEKFIGGAKDRSRVFRGSNPLPVPAAAAGAKALRLVRENPAFISRVQENARSLRRRLRSIGLSAEDSPVPIISLELGNAENMQRIQKALADEGVLIAYNEAYSGVSSEGLLRIAVFSSHTDEMLQRLSGSIARLL